MTILDGKNDGRWWIVAWVAPLSCLAVGVLSGIASSGSQNDWLGGSIIIPILVFTGVGCVSAIFAGVVSCIRREKNCAMGLIPGIIAILVIYLVAVKWYEFHADQARYKHVEQRRTERQVNLGETGNRPNQALQHNDPSCHVSCLRTPRASRCRG
jgi:hypothetical protein